MPETASITPLSTGKVWLKSIRWPFLNRPIDVRTWDAPQRSGRSALMPVDGRSAPVGAAAVLGSREFTLSIVTGDIFDDEVDPMEQARDFDLIFASGDWFFIHVPPSRGVPGGYVLIENVSEDRWPRKGETGTRVFEVTFKVVVPPGPDVVGTTMTWATVERLYDSWDALLASNPTWIDLLALVGSPEDVVVL
jgi:hypothetical protein